MEYTVLVPLFGVMSEPHSDVSNVHDACEKQLKFCMKLHFK